MLLNGGNVTVIALPPDVSHPIKLLLSTRVVLEIIDVVFNVLSEGIIAKKDK